jgi:hypothetical protein
MFIYIDWLTQKERITEKNIELCHIRCHDLFCLSSRHASNKIDFSIQYLLCVNQDGKPAGRNLNHGVQ